ncbi:MAG: IPT/TIG domain-containing protein [Clostridium sp.]|nr:IPT/TIG domain-containing protein [Bacteroides sp.]MCM1197780.1 IPT/TIG domain-containing protein [Clostridium sp.]
MKKIFKATALIAAFLMIFSSCQEELGTDQYSNDTVSLNVYGPQPVMRGGQLRFLGSNLDKIAEVIIPGVSPITDIEVVQAGVPSEIRVMVPKDGPEPGKVTLRTADGKEIVTKTELTYSEPIEFESFSPASVKPGDVLTIKGDYLNLIHEVVFADDVKVSEKEFTKHTRYEIAVKVPIEARTGEIALGDIDELNNEDENAIPNLIYSEEELIVAQPEVTKMTAPRFKAGETVTVTGKNFDYVASVKLPGATVEDFKVASGNSTLTFVLPAEAQDGEAYLVAKSGVEILAGDYETVVPSGLAAAPKPVKAGAELTVSGKDLDLVTSVSLPAAEGAEFEYGSDSITLTVPDTAQEGEITLSMANGKQVTVEYTLVKPVVTEYSANPAPAGSEIVIKGTDLDLVTSITFGGDLTVAVEPSETEITVSVPTTAESAALKFNLANGTYIEGDKLDVEKPTACYITELPAEGTEIFGGTVLIVPVENADRLTGVQVNDEDVNYWLNNQTLYLSLPDMAGAGTVVRLVSDNGAVEYTINCIPNNIQNKVIWSGSWECGNWGGNQDLAWGGFDWTTVDLSAGTVSIVLELEEDTSAGWWQVSFRHGDSWGNVPDLPGQYDLEAGQTSLEVVLTQTLLDDLIANGGLVLTGCNYTLKKVIIRTEISMDTVIWEGSEYSTDDMSVNLELGDEMDWANAGLKEGQNVRIYFTAADTEEWKIQVFGGHWEKWYLDGEDGQQSSEALYGPAFKASNWDASRGYIEFKATGDLYTSLTTQQWWGSALILQGKYVTFTKISFI